jgi:hypothetical protein
MWRCARFFASSSNTSTVDVKFLFYLSCSRINVIRKKKKGRKVPWAPDLHFWHMIAKVRFISYLTYVSEAWKSSCSFAEQGCTAGERKKTVVGLRVYCSLKLSGLSEYWSGPTVVCNVLQISKFGHTSPLLLEMFNKWRQNDGKNDFNPLKPTTYKHIAQWTL